MSLLALQRDFQRHLVDVPGSIGVWVDNPAPGLAVYHNAYRVQLTECLAETFAQTLAWIGGDGFVAAARSHIESTPPSGWTLGIYGDGFDDALAKLYPDDPEVVELARLEWLLARAFDAANEIALPSSTIATIDWDTAGLAFVANLRLTPALTNAGAIWSALAAGDPPPAAMLLPGPGATLVWRQDFLPCFRTIERIEQEAIALVTGGLGFAGLCEMLVAAQGEAAGIARAGAMLGQWFADGLITEVNKKDSTCV